MLVLAGTGVLAYLYHNQHKARGVGMRLEKLPEQCGRVSDATLQRMRTTNPNRNLSQYTDQSGWTFMTCNWDQTKGRDGAGYRGLNILLNVYSKESGGKSPEEQAKDKFAAEEKLAATRPRASSDQARIEPVNGVEDQAFLVISTSDSAFTGVSIIVRSGDRVIEVDYSGWDPGFVSPQPPDIEDWKKAVRQVAQEILAKS